MSKDAGFKVVTHMMPDLPNMGIERDLESFREFFENPAFRPDGLKVCILINKNKKQIYPTLVIRGTGLYELWKNGKYRNYPPDLLVDIVAKILALVPPWTRVYRVQRDIPMPLVSSGVGIDRVFNDFLLREWKSTRIVIGQDERYEFALQRCQNKRSRYQGGIVKRLISIINKIHFKIKPE